MSDWIHNDPTWFMSHGDYSFFIEKIFYPVDELGATPSAGIKYNARLIHLDELSASQSFFSLREAMAWCESFDL